MSWHYQIRKRVIDKEEVFDIVERYSNPDGWTVEGMKPVGDTKEEIIRDIEMMLADAKKYPVMEEK